VAEATTPELTVAEVPALTCVIRRQQARMDELAEVIPRLIAETHAWVSEHGGWNGPPLAVIAEPDTDGLAQIEVGWPVAAGAEPPAPLEAVTYPRARAVVHQHVGPYERLHEAYVALERAMAAAELRPAGPARESYMTNPEEEPDREKWVTEIVWPVE
jgi:effector-binding domain-containing protein